MNQEDKKGVVKERIQNWVAFGLMMVGIALAVVGYNQALYVIGAGAILGLFFVLKRTFSRGTKRLSILAIIAVLCGLYVAFSGLLYMCLLPQMYGYDLQGYFNWIMSIVIAVFGLLVSVNIELFRASK